MNELRLADFLTVLRLAREDKCFDDNFWTDGRGEENARLVEGVDLCIRVDDRDGDMTREERFAETCDREVGLGEAFAVGRLCNADDRAWLLREERFTREALGRDLLAFAECEEEAWADDFPWDRPRASAASGNGSQITAQSKPTKRFRKVG